MRAPRLNNKPVLVHFLMHPNEKSEPYTRSFRLNSNNSVVYIFGTKSALVSEYTGSFIVPHSLFDQTTRLKSHSDPPWKQLSRIRTNE
jgi:hypothetical protein